MKERLWVSWRTKDTEAIEQIRRYFGMPRYTTINGLTPCEINAKDMAMLKETARRGFLSILHEKWCKNGDLYSFNDSVKFEVFQPWLSR